MPPLRILNTGLLSDLWRKLRLSGPPVPIYLDDRVVMTVPVQEKALIVVNETLNLSSGNPITLYSVPANKRAYCVAIYKAATVGTVTIYILDPSVNKAYYLNAGSTGVVNTLLAYEYPIPRGGTIVLSSGNVADTSIDARAAILEEEL